jgi:hypothetical protein
LAAHFFYEVATFRWHPMLVGECIQLTTPQKSREVEFILELVGLRLSNHRHAGIVIDDEYANMRKT